MQPDGPWYESAPAIVGGILATAGAVFGFVLHWWRRLRPEWLSYRANIRADRFFGDQERMRMRLRTWRRNTGAMRGILIVARNCGWLDASQDVLVSVVTESEDDDTPTVYERFRDWPADGAYKQLLHDLHAAQGRPILVLQSDMLAGRLRDHYRHQGTVASVVFMLGFNPSGGMLYVSLNFGANELGRSHPSGLWGDPTSDQPSPAWNEAAELEVRKARRLVADPEAVRGMRIEGSRVWFGK